MSELSEKIDALIVAAGRPSYDSIAREIKAAGGPTISAPYLWQLRTGARTNPTFQHLQALATYFSGKLNVPITLSYFEASTPVDQPWRDAEDANRLETLERQLAEEREMSAKLADRGVRHFAGRYGSMSPEMQKKILAIADTLAETDEAESSTERDANSNS
ncbi:hypothetical protein H7X46_00345 [Pseudonocardia sp. C8]|uniref:hypothetical protein n=1 Tax=Pseudonocardia sp. C8 TaxID=2762759 RepID=UPI001642E218|nr:hypothetical protein [Pseudonocardia sp. C8]